MKHLYQAVILLLITLSGCKEKNPEEFRLTAEQLAWQPYRTGDVLRFGQAQSSKVRTFAITEVDNRFDTYSLGGSIPVYLGPRKRITVQSINVRARRTDTLRYVRTPTSTPTQPDSVPFTYPTTLLELAAGHVDSDGYAYVGWDIGFNNSLPLSQVLQGITPYDTTQQLLPMVRLGGIEYGPVLRISNPSQTLLTGFPRVQPARYIYYAKDYGVVGFAEGSTLWYRLP